MRFTVHVEVKGRDGIADPEGKTIERALPALGFSGVSGVRVGKVISFALDAADQAAAEDAVAQMCDRLLANPVMQQTEVTVTASPGGPPR